MKLEYEKQLSTMIDLMKMKAEKENDSYTVSLDYLNKHNQSCPGCNKPFPASGGKIKGIGTIGFIELYNKKNTLYMYGICINCTNVYTTSTNTDRIEKNIELNLSRKLGIKL